MLTLIDRFLNGVTMYRLVLYVLSLLALIAIGFSVLGLVSHSPLALVLSLVVFTLVTWSINELIAWVLGIPANPESSVITAGILFFIISPPTTLFEVGMVALTAGVAVVSKYLFVWRKQHILNPAAVAALLVGTFTGIATWWIATAWLMPFVLIAALLVVRKVRRFALFLTTVFTAAVLSISIALSLDIPLEMILTLLATSWPLIFFAGFMVTEPFTSPGTERGRLIYGLGIGLLASIPVYIWGPLTMTPELALVVANAIAFPFGLGARLVLTLKEKREIAQDTYEFSFAASPRPSFHAGQYLEWTLPHTSPDLRGIRRYFTIASSPTEEDLKLGVKFFANGSSFKRALLALTPGSKIHAAMRGGDFILPEDTQEKLVFISGGIGVTPFRSMIHHLIATAQRRDIHLLYACKTWPEIAYRPLFEQAAQEIGLRTTYVLSESLDGAPEGTERGFIDAAMLQRLVPDYNERTFYLSGPDAMVQAYRRLLRGLGVTRIHTDYFPGF